MDWQKGIIAAIGLTITILSTFGIVTSSEGAELSANGTAVATGILGLVSTITAIVKRHKGDNAPKAEE